jgi:hypothetical protein
MAANFQQEIAANRSLLRAATQPKGGCTDPSVGILQINLRRESTSVPVLKRLYDVVFGSIVPPAPPIPLATQTDPRPYEGRHELCRPVDFLKERRVVCEILQGVHLAVILCKLHIRLRQ